MKEVVLITGANGMVAKQLAKGLEDDYSVRFLSRRKTRSDEYIWDLNNNYIDTEALTGVNSIIHLAGTSIANKRWTKKRKKIILSSRVDSANLILRELHKHRISIDAFISASAVGYYGTNTTSATYDENSPRGSDFLSEVCMKWEDAADYFKSSGIAGRIAILRIGIILSQTGGVLGKLVQPIKNGYGTGLGSGNQYIPWIHIRDLVRMFKFVLDDKMISGTFNAVSPEHISNIELTKAIASHINRHLILPNIPKFIIRALYGEMSLILLEGSKVTSEKIMKTGFKFEYEKLDKALDNLLDKDYIT